MNTPNDNSFRDPCGFIFMCSENMLTRLIRPYDGRHYEQLFNSGLYDDLTVDGLLIPHHEIPVEQSDTEQYGEIYKLIQPEVIQMVSYPYEWSFSQLKAAALATLTIQKKALSKGMTLKDAPAHNIQFKGCQPLLIDSLSFEIYQPGDVWKAYGQFCRNFLAPLLLMNHDYRLSEIMLYEMDGAPLDLTSKLLPRGSWLSFGALLHIHLHAKALKVCKSGGSATAKRRNNSLNSLLGLIDSLESLISRLKWKIPATEWGDYYNNNNYSANALSAKEQLVDSLLARLPAGMAWDFGANDGRFSELAARRGCYTVAMDIDPVAVENNFIRHRDSASMLPLRIDLRNPSPGNGWNGRERLSLFERGPADTGMALALIHHLAISNNVPFLKIAQCFASACKNMIIEFIPKSDSMVQKLLSSRQDIFSNYDQQTFEADFSKFFTVHAVNRVAGSERTIYLMKKIQD